MVQTVKAAQVKAKESILYEVCGTGDDPLDSYFQADYAEGILLMIEVEMCEEALAKACVLNITSDLRQVAEIFNAQEDIVSSERSEAAKLRLSDKLREGIDQPCELSVGDFNQPKPHPQSPFIKTTRATTI